MDNNKVAERGYKDNETKQVIDDGTNNGMYGLKDNTAGSITKLAEEKRKDILKEGWSEESDLDILIKEYEDIEIITEEERGGTLTTNFVRQIFIMK